MAGFLELNRSIRKFEGFLLPKTANEVIWTKLGTFKYLLHDHGRVDFASPTKHLRGR